MVVSDDDYVEGSDDEIGIQPRSRDGPSGTRSKSTRANKDSTGFEVTRTWENLTEGADGTITGAVEGLIQAGKRQRLFISITKHFLGSAIMADSPLCQTFEGYNTTSTRHHPSCYPNP
jgi:hypothetical protein